MAANGPSSNDVMPLAANRASSNHILQFGNGYAHLFAASCLSVTSRPCTLRASYRGLLGCHG
ncbi:hypothetical protein E2562_036476 [Oryza meyeriana var. granulata]|uniref:Uncharacterized protein n=1 Tax=Oryza meyeriana var. granulata TaxID=110450 RepID=A0A6G1DSV3_9ORYZ|nr:hypothetical protein E2562_036476 [Oryza meyeriana var. granulata]